MANGRRLVKWLLAYLPNSHNRPEFQRHKFPGISLGVLNEEDSKKYTDYRNTAVLKVEQLSDLLFRILACAKTEKTSAFLAACCESLRSDGPLFNIEKVV